MATKNVWILNSQNCGIMGAYTTKKRAIHMANCHLSQGLNFGLVGDFVLDEGERHVELASTLDFVTLDKVNLNSTTI